MNTEQQIVRRCKDCPTWTQTVCHHAFGVFWCIKSGDGEGCNHPLDAVADAWKESGWRKTKSTRPVMLEKKKLVQVQSDLFSALTDADY